MAMPLGREGSLDRVGQKGARSFSLGATIAQKIEELGRQKIDSSWTGRRCRSKSGTLRVQKGISLRGTRHVKDCFEAAEGWEGGAELNQMRTQRRVLAQKKLITIVRASKGHPRKKAVSCHHSYILQSEGEEGAARRIS